MAERIVYDAQGYPELELELEGLGPVRISAEQLKRSLVDLGFVYLGAGFAGRVPSVTLEADEADGRPERELEGFSTDPAVVAAVRRYLARLDGGDLPYREPRP